MTDPAPECAFARALIAGEAGCALARRSSRAETVSIACASPVAAINCATLVALLRERARFALRLPAVSAPLPHVQAMRLQCGGTMALAHALGSPRALDVHELISQARERWGSLSDLPFASLVADLAAWEPRRRRDGGRP